jgi:NADH-quinone oxidoreductase subunit L
MLLSAGVGLGGIWAAYIIYVKKEGRPAQRIAGRLGALYHLACRTYYVDEFYNKAVAGGVLVLGRLAAWFDVRVIDALVDGSAAFVRGLAAGSVAFDEKVVDGAVNGIGAAHRFFSRKLAGVQSGYMYNYALSIVIGLVLLVGLAVVIF